MNLWDVWISPWIAASQMTCRTLEALGGQKDSAAAMTSGAPEWTSANRIALELSALRLRDFSDANSRRQPALIVAPFALHDAAIADLASGHSLVETLRANGCSRLLLVEWKSGTQATKLDTIDTQIAALNVAIDEIGVAVDLIGLCQGGWLSLVYAARFPSKVRRIVLAGAPVDLVAERSALSAQAKNIPKVVIEDMIDRGNGLVRGENMLGLWPQASEDMSLIMDALQLSAPPANQSEQLAADTFLRWHRRTLDLPGPYYREVHDWLFRENRLASGNFVALGRVIELRKLRCPLFLLAGAEDVVAPPAQAFAAAALVGAKKSDIEMTLASCGHHALFMGRRTLAKDWPKIAQWLQRPRIEGGKSSGKQRASRMVKEKKMAVRLANRSQAPV
jgi:poly(3-hydroxyalkanoate) synthetase